MEIKLCKLVDGTYAVGKITSEGNLVEAVEMLVMPNPTSNSIGIAMVPLMYPINPELENDIVISASKILMSIKPNEDILAKYTEVTTGIITPSLVMPN